jgi:SAM-dependent methyltransferase
LDIGSGRGEFLQLLKTNKVRAVGLDINYDMVKRSKDKSLEAVQDDALTHLLAAKSQSYGAITGFHIVEHIPFNNLMRIFISAHRALVSNGFVIFETPNPENIIVASSGFYTDPTHLNPLPPDLLAFALKSCGFREVEILRLHPVDAEPGKIAALPEELRFRFYGPRDYAVIGYK